MCIYKKIFKAKQEIGKIFKDSKNPFFKKSYLSLNGLIDSIEHVFVDNGLLLLQPIEKGFVKTIIIDLEGKEGMDSVTSEMQLPSIQDPQKIGSAITYYRRYTLQSLLSLKAEDDDGNLASNPIVMKPTEKLKKCTSLKQLQSVYSSLTRTEKEFTLTLKDELKQNLK
jgi:hypothetical protein